MLFLPFAFTLFLYCIIPRALSVITINNNYVTAWTALSNQTYRGQYIHEGGKIGIVIVMSSNFEYFIMKYNLTVSPPLKMGQVLINTWNIPDRFFVFNDYLVGYSSVGSSILIYNYTSIAFIAQKSIFNSYVPVEFAYAKSKGFVVFTVKAGFSCFINETNFPLNIDLPFQTIALPGAASGYRYSGYLSSSQQSYIMLCVEIHKIFIASLTSLSIVFTYNVADQLCSAAWHPNQQIAYFSQTVNGLMYIVNVTNSFSVTSIVYIPSTYTKIPMTIRYFSDWDCIVGIALSMDQTYGFFFYELNTSNFGFIDGLFVSLLKHGFSSDSGFFWQFNDTNIYFYEINGCTSGYVYDFSSKSCKSCANLSRCSKVVLSDLITNNNTINSTNTTNTANISNTSTNTSANVTNTNTNVTNATNVTTNTTNTTNPTTINSTNATNTSVNITNTPSIPIIKNITIIPNLTNTTVSNITNTTSSNKTQNSTILPPSQIDTSLIDFINSQHLINYENFINNTLGNPTISALNQFPGARKIISVLFSFFVNFDDLWLYNYHPRNYDPIFTVFFTKINQLERQKWSLLPFEKIVDFLGFDKNTYQRFFQIRKLYTSTKFLEVEDNQNGFLPNTPNFLFSNIFFTIFTFLSMKIMLTLTSRFKISRLLKEYAFWGFLFLMIIEGNLQYFGYILTFDMTKLFSTVFAYKVMNFIVIMISFCLILFGGFIYFFFKQAYRKKSRRLFGNFRSSLNAVTNLTLCMTWRNLMLGATHSFFEEDYRKKIFLLGSVQILFVIQQIMLISAKKGVSLVKNKLMVWCDIIFASMIRIMLIFSLVITYTKDSQIQTFLSISLMKVEIQLIYCYLITFIVTVTRNLSSLGVEIVSLIKSHRKKNKNKKKVIVSENKIKYSSKIQVKKKTIRTMHTTPSPKQMIGPKVKYQNNVWIVQFNSMKENKSNKFYW